MLGHIYSTVGMGDCYTNIQDDHGIKFLNVRSRATAHVQTLV